MFDTIHRHVPVIEDLQNDPAIADLSILDVGPNGPGVCRFLARGGPRVTGLDIKLPEEPDGESPVHQSFAVYDGSLFPFRDSAFDYAVAIDVLEHIPRERRSHFLGELARVSRKSVLLVFPEKRAERSERVMRFLLGNKSEFLREHELYGLPGEEEVRDFFEGYNVRVKPLMNAFLWIPLKIASSIYIRLFADTGRLSRVAHKIYRGLVYPLLNFGTPYSVYMRIDKR
jgi:ubiquinone/menaquinone biosynthesis C-methylase UbiE